MRGGGGGHQPRTMVRTLGVEEELLLVDPETRQLGSRSPQVLKEFREHGAGREPAVADDDLDSELFRHQVEIRTKPETDLAETRAQVLASRRHAAESAEAAELVIVASGIVPCGGLPPQVSDDDRYRRMMEIFGGIATYGGTCGMHVHVAIDSDEQGVAVIDRIAPWLPVLVADRRQLAVQRGRGHRLRLLAQRELGRAGRARPAPSSSARSPATGTPAGS